MKADCVTSPTEKGREGSEGRFSGRLTRRGLGLTVGCHYGCEHRLDFVHGHYAVSEERLQEHPVHVGVGFFVRYVAHQRCFVTRHVGCELCDMRGNVVIRRVWG